MKQLPFPVATIEAKVLLKGQEKSSGLCISRYLLLLEMQQAVDKHNLT